MLQPFMHLLSTKRIILASGSPRRKQILENVGLNVEVMVSNVEENLDKASFANPADYATETALLKAMSVAEQLKNDKVPPSFVIGADTVVTMDNVIYEKPVDEADACRMLNAFSGRTHTVYTGVVLIALRPENAETSERFLVEKFNMATDVEFDNLSPEVVAAYVKTGEPMDKAGGYGIQVRGGTFIKSIHGDYFNVMGFPLNLFSKRLANYLQTHYCSEKSTNTSSLKL